jgi:hypothetical protein
VDFPSGDRAAQQAIHRQFELAPSTTLPGTATCQSLAKAGDILNEILKIGKSSFPAHCWTRYKVLSHASIPSVWKIEMGYCREISIVAICCSELSNGCGH